MLYVRHTCRVFINHGETTVSTSDLSKRILSLFRSPEAVEVGHDVLAFAVVDDPSLRHEADDVKQLVRLGRRVILAGYLIAGSIGCFVARSWHRFGLDAMGTAAKVEAYRVEMKQTAGCG